MDEFQKFLENRDNDELATKALTDRSYKKVYQKENHSEMAEDNINAELGTYGDAVLKLALCKILFDSKVKNISEEKKNYESDKVLVDVVARHYDVLKYINFDCEDQNMPHNYDYRGDTYKYIATAVEACLAVIYLKHEKTEKGKGLEIIIQVVEAWIKLIDSKKPSTLG